jgi:hypothetical protein
MVVLVLRVHGFFAAVNHVQRRLLPVHPASMASLPASSRVVIGSCLEGLRREGVAGDNAIGIHSGIIAGKLKA